MRAPRIALGVVAALGLAAACDNNKPTEGTPLPPPAGQQGAPLDTSPANPKTTGPIVREVAPAVANPAGKSDGPASISVPPGLTVSTADPDVIKGKETFALKGCIACHKVGGGKLVGPDLKDVLKRRTETWVAKMILKPEVMIKEDDTAKDLFRTHLIPMANQNVNPATELPFILAYLKSESK